MTANQTQDIFDSVVTRGVCGESTTHEMLVHLSWTLSSQGDRLVQVYINDELYTVSADPAQRDLWLVIDRSRTQRIELLAIDTTESVDPWMLGKDELASWWPRVKKTVSLTITRDESLAVDTRLTFEIAGRVERRALWTHRDPRGGFGALFGEGGFGYDNASYPAFDRESTEPFNPDSASNPLVWSSDDLPAGSHTLLLTATNKHGRPASSPQTLDTVTVEALPKAPRNMVLDSENQLSWTP